MILAEITLRAVLGGGLFILILLAFAAAIGNL